MTFWGYEYNKLQKKKYLASFWFSGLQGQRRKY